jgi:hypothetical protein
MEFCNALYGLAQFFDQFPIIGGFFAWILDTLRNISFLGCT